MNIIYIALGGALGAVARYVMVLLSHTVLGRDFPYGTLIVNVSGSFLLGLLSVLLLDRITYSVELRAFLLVGFLGALTTFSSFSLETVTLFNEGRMLLAALNILANVVVCLLVVWFGILVARTI